MYDPLKHEWVSSESRNCIIEMCVFFPPFLSGIICTCEKLGERASKTSQSKYCNSFGWKQGRPCQQESVGLSGLWCLNSHRRADASCWLYKWDVELFTNKQTNKHAVQTGFPDALQLSVKRLKPCLSLFFFHRTHSRMQMTTVCCLWKHRQRLQWTWTRFSWPLVSYERVWLTTFVK